MSITDEQLKGNWAEQFIASNLSSQGCFIRRVTQGQDSGIDLYCETIKGGIPFLHFWCQVKTSKNWKGIRKQISFQPKKNHIEYWLKQPIPVFIFLVPDLRDEINIPYYIFRAIDLKFSKGKLKSQLKIESSKDLSKFLNKDLILETYLWELKDGKISHLKTPKKEYTIKFPSAIAHVFEQELFESLHWTLWRLSQDILFHEIDPKDVLNKSTLNSDESKRFLEAEPYMKALEILIVEKNDSHYQNYATIGVYHELKKDCDKSLKFYNESLSILNKDPHLDRSNPPWNDVIDSINDHIVRVKSKMGL